MLSLEDRLRTENLHWIGVCPHRIWPDDYDNDNDNDDDQIIKNKLN